MSLFGFKYNKLKAMWELKEWCKNFDKVSIDWLNMLIHNKKDKVVIKMNELIKECLGCWKTFTCDKGNDLFKFLDENYYGKDKDSL